jgi:Domain of unknown function (DUF397)
VADQLKPTVEQLGIDPGALEWQRSGVTSAAIEVAFVGGSGPDGWVLMRTPAQSGLVLVFSQFEWECFLDGVKKGEFDDAGS